MCDPSPLLVKLQSSETKKALGFLRLEDLIFEVGGKEIIVGRCGHEAKTLFFPTDAPLGIFPMTNQLFMCLFDHWVSCLDTLSPKPLTGTTLLFSFPPMFFFHLNKSTRVFSTIRDCFTMLAPLIEPSLIEDRSKSS